jgi:hypothetical protein
MISIHTCMHNKHACSMYNMHACMHTISHIFSYHIHSNHNFDFQTKLSGSLSKHLNLNLNKTIAAGGRRLGRPCLDHKHDIFQQYHVMGSVRGRSARHGCRERNWYAASECLCMCSLDVPWVLFGCTLGALWMYLGCSLDVPWVLFRCASGALWMYLGCSLDVPWVLFGCTLGALWMYLGCSLDA